MPEFDWVPEAEDGFEEGTDEVSGREDRPPPATILPRVDGRASRLVSFEQEIGGDSRELARAFHAEGLSPFDTVLAYHSGSNYDSAWLYVEDDSTVDGEVIYSRLRLDRLAVARKVEDALGVVHEHIVDDLVGLDSRCGFHVHVGVGFDAGGDYEGGEIRAYSMDDVRSLYHLWNHCEDTMYRLASANWKRHRSDHGNDYAQPIGKGYDSGSVIGFGSNLARARCGINFGPYLGARGHCGCSAAVYGAWSECTCALGKPTVEFRVFNATANTRKVRAYTALSLALVGFATQESVTPETFPIRPWRGSSNMLADESAGVLRFMLEDLPLTADERADVIYCAETSMRGGAGSLASVLEEVV